MVSFAAARWRPGALRVAIPGVAVGTIRFPETTIRMSLADYLRELAFPFVSLATVFAVLVFAMLFSLATFAGLFGIWLFVATLPAWLRYLTMIAEARAREREADPPGIEFFSLVGNVWTFFPGFVAIAAVALLLTLYGVAGIPAVVAVACAFVLIWPATIGVLVITHSPLQSLNPVALARFIRGCGIDYAYAPLTAVLLIGLAALIGPLLPGFTVVAALFLSASLFAVTGAVMRAGRLVDEVDIPDAIEPDADVVISRLQRERTGVLNHAYGFASRGNRQGGLAHISDWLLRDPDPDDAWPWFLEQMLRWEDTMPALLFAQRYLSILLGNGEQVRAVKLLMRCRMIDEHFRPLPADLPMAIAAAEACRNEDLATVLSR